MKLREISNELQGFQEVFLEVRGRFQIYFVRYS